MPQILLYSRIAPWSHRCARVSRGIGTLCVAVPEQAKGWKHWNSWVMSGGETLAPPSSWGTVGTEGTGRRQAVPQDSGVSWSSTIFCSTVRIPAFCPKHWIYCVLFFTMFKKNGCDKHFLFNHTHLLLFETSLFLSETPYLSLFSTELCICIFHKSKITSERSTNPSSNPSGIFASLNTHS